MKPNIAAFQGIVPHLADGVFVHESAHVIGDVELGARASVWHGAVIRGDVNRIRIGAETNIQDLSVLHVSHKSAARPEGAPLLIGDRVTVGHRAILHGGPRHGVEYYQGDPKHTDLTLMAQPGPLELELEKDTTALFQVADDLYDALTGGQCSFWDHVYPLFIARDVTRHDVRSLVREGLAATHGHYQAVVRLFGMPDGDYKRLHELPGVARLHGGLPAVSLRHPPRGARGAARAAGRLQAPPSGGRTSEVRARLRVAR